MILRKIKVAAGIFWVEIPEAELYILCGCPADSVKHLMKKGLINTLEKDGRVFETGPNGILLSDLPMQDERFANLAEFPVLQMLYRQGMFLPNHPNNKGIKPLLIGIENEVKAQAEYIYRGNYGLTSMEEIMEAGIPEEKAREMMRLKLAFAFDRIRRTDELLETRIIEQEPVELRNGVFIRRKGINQYEFTYRDQTVAVDLNLGPGEEYDPPYHLEYHQFKREYFSVIHTGEGDGWDPNRPCMSSIVTFQGKIYLIDSGPSLMYNLQAMGIGVSEIEGIIQTHAHDDHFNGLTVLLRSDHRIKYYSTKLVRLSVMKKLAALTGMDEALFDKYFETHDLEADTWNNIDGLEIMPVYSPHPVETSVMFLRSLWGDGYKTYAHLADIAALDLLEKMINDDPARSGINREYYEKVRQIYLKPVQLKKIDIGGGMIHGHAEDFKDDRSARIILSHTALELTDSQKVIGDTASFGAMDVLIPSDRDYSKPFAFQYLQTFFPGVPSYEIEMLLNCPVVSLNPGTILIKQGEKSPYVFCVLNGMMEYIVPDREVKNQLTVGSMIAEMACLKDTKVSGTYRAVNYVKALQIDATLYIEFLRRNNLLEFARKEVQKRHFLEWSWLFGERIACPIKSRITHGMHLESCRKGTVLSGADSGGVLLLCKGEIGLYEDGREIEVLQPGDFWGEESILHQSYSSVVARSRTGASFYRIPGELIENIPIIQWKLLETFARRSVHQLGRE
ncbi:MAG: cyclic nucleotide-binding domain-containing protein [Deltaproteobacteria bacterium]